MANVDIKLGYKDSAWFTANAAIILKIGQIVYLEQTGTYKIGDGVTALSALSFLGGGGTQNLQQVINESPTVDGVLTESLDGETYISINDNQIVLSSTDGTDSTEVSVTPTAVSVSAQNGTDAASLTVTATSIDFTANSVTKNSSEIATQSYVDGMVAGLLDDRGSYDASTNLFPSTGGSGTAGAILKGDIWYISVAGTLGGVPVTVGDSVRSLVDTPAQTSTNWSVLETNIGYVPENVANKSSSYTASSTTTYANTKALVDGLSLKTDKALRGYVSGGNFTTTSLTLVNITGLSVALDANSVYEINIKLTYESSSNAGLNTGVNFSAAGATIEAGEVGSRDGEVGKVARITAFNTSGASTAFIRLSATPQTHEIKGIVRTGANAGNLTAQVAKVLSGTATVYIDSYIRAQKV